MVLLILAGVLGLAALGLVGYVVYTTMAGRSKEESPERYTPAESYAAVEHVEEVREEPVQEPALDKPSNESESLATELASLKSIHRSLQVEFENYKKSVQGSQAEIEKSKQSPVPPPPAPEDSAEVVRLRSELGVFEKLVGEKNEALDKALKETANWQAKFKETLAANEASAQEIAAVHIKLKDALAAKDSFAKEKEEFVKKTALVQSLTQEVESFKKKLAEKDGELAQRVAASQAASADTVKALEEESQKTNAEIQRLKETIAAQAQVPHIDPAELETLKQNISDKDTCLEKMKAEMQTLQDTIAQAQKVPKIDPAEIEVLRKEIADKDAALAKLTSQIADSVQQKGVSQEEYNKLKTKLEAAEKVLRVVHGAV